MKCKSLFVFCCAAVAYLPVAANTFNSLYYQKLRAPELYRAGRYLDSKLEFERLKGRTPLTRRTDREMCDAYVSLASMYVNDKSSDAILEAFNRNYKESTYGNDADYMLGLIYSKKHDFKRSKESFARVNYATLDAARRDNYNIRMGYISFLDGDMDNAGYYFERISSKSEFYPHALYYKSYIAFVKGNLDYARSGFEELRNSEVYAPIVPYYILQIEFKRGNYLYVTGVGERLLKSTATGSRSEIERLVAEAWYFMDDYTKSVNHMLTYQKSGGKMGREELYILGYGLYRMARYEDAESVLVKVCGADDALTQNASYHLADCYIRRGDKRKALHSFAMAANEGLNRDVAQEALFNYGKLQFELGGDAFNETINILKRYLALYPTSNNAAQVKELLAAAYFNSKNYDAAYDALKSMPDADGELRAALQKIAYYKGLSAFNSGDVAGSVAFFKESRQIDVSPKYSALSTFWLGEVAFLGGDYAKAKGLYSDFVSRAPKSEREVPFALYNIGYCNFKLGNLAAAQKSFDEYLTQYPSKDSYRADAMNRVADVMFSQRHYATAATEYGEVALMPFEERYYAQYQLAVTRGVEGRDEEKITLLKEIIAHQSGAYVEQATYELGRTYLGLGRYADGVAQLELFVNQYPNSEYQIQALSDLGLSYLNTGDEEKSKLYYEMVVEKAGKSPSARDAMMGIREIYVSRGDVDGFFDYASKTGLDVDSGMLTRDSLSFAAARKIYLDERYSAAQKSFRSYLKNYATGYYVDDALYFLADCYVRGGDESSAADVFEQLTSREQTQYTLRSLEYLADYNLKNKRYDKAAATNRRMFDVSKDAATRDAALLGYLRQSVRTGQDSVVLAVCADVDSLPTSNAVKNEARFAKAKVVGKSAEGVPEAMNIYQSLAADVSTPYGAESAYLVAQWLFDQGKTDESERMVFDLAAKNSPHSHWVAKSFILLGDIYVTKGDTFQARATYQSIVDGYSPANDGIVVEARERIAKLKR